MITITEKSNKNRGEQHPIKPMPLLDSLYQNSAGLLLSPGVKFILMSQICTHPEMALLSNPLKPAPVLPCKKLTGRVLALALKIMKKENLN